MRRQIKVHIEALRLAEQLGTPAVVGDEIRAELQRLLDQRGVPPAASTHLDRVETRPVAEGDRDGPSAAVARVVYEGMRSRETDTR